MTLYNEQLNAMANMGGYDLQTPRKVYRNVGIGAAGLAATAGLYAANTVGNPNERWDRTAINTAGNLGGIAAASIIPSVGIPGMAIKAGGALLGGYLSDRAADMFDPTGGQMLQAEAANTLLNQYLQITPQPFLDEAQARAELMAARQAQKDQATAIRNYREQMMQQYSG